MRGILYRVFILYSVYIAAYIYVCILNSDGHGVVRHVHCADSAAVAESVHASSHRIAALRCVLGFLLLIHLHYQRDGQGGHQVMRNLKLLLRRRDV